MKETTLKMATRSSVYYGSFLVAGLGKHLSKRRNTSTELDSCLKSSLFQSHQCRGQRILQFERACLLCCGRCLGLVQITA